MAIDVNKVCSILDISTSKTEAVANVEFLIASSIELAESYCIRSFSLKTYKEKFIGNRNDYVITKNYPVVEVLTPPITVIFIDKNEISFSKKLNNGVYIIEYRAGYEVFPEDLEQAIIELVGWRYKRIEHLDISVNRAENGSTVSYITDEIPLSVKFIFDRYKRRY